MVFEHANEHFEHPSEYVKICGEEVRTITGIEFDAHDQKGRPSLDFHFRQDSGWTSGESTNQAFVLRVMTFTDYSTLLHDQSA